MKKLVTAALAAGLAASLVGTSAVPAGAADAVSVRKIGSKTVKPGKKATIKPIVRASGRVKLGTPRVTVKRKGRTVAANRTRVRLRAGTYRVTTSVRYRTYVDRPTWTTRVMAAKGTGVDARCTFTSTTPRGPVTTTPAPPSSTPAPPSSRPGDPVGDVADGVGDVADGVGGAADDGGAPVVGDVPVIVDELEDVLGDTVDAPASPAPGTVEDGVGGAVDAVEDGVGDAVDDVTDVVDTVVPGLGGLLPGGTGTAKATSTSAASEATVLVHDYTATCRWNGTQAFTVSGTLAGTEEPQRTVIGYPGESERRSVQVASAPSAIRGSTFTLPGVATPVALTRQVRTGTKRTYSAVKVKKRTQTLKVKTRKSSRR